MISAEEEIPISQDLSICRRYSQRGACMLTPMFIRVSELEATGLPRKQHIAEWQQHNKPLFIPTLLIWHKYIVALGRRRPLHRRSWVCFIYLLNLQCLSAGWEYIKRPWFVFNECARIAYSFYQRIKINARSFESTISKLACDNKG